MEKKRKRRYLNVLEMRREKKMTFEQIGKKLGVKRQRAHQLYRKALNLETSNTKSLAS